MKRFKLIFFMSLILILILGTSSQAVISEDYMNYIWTNLENNSDFNIGIYNTNFKSYLKQLTSEQKNSVKTKINQYLYVNNLNYEDINLNVFLKEDAEVTFRIYFVFSNNTAPNNNDLGYLEIKKDNYDITKLYVKDNDSFIKYLRVSVYYYKNSLHFTVDDFKDLTSNGLSINLGKTAYSENTETFYSSNISCYSLIQVAYIGYPISSTSSEKTRFLCNYSAYLNKDDGAYIPQEPDIPDKPSGDTGTGGTTGTITNQSGDTTGKVDLSGIEQGIGAVKDAVNNVTNTIKDAFTFDSGDANEVMEDFKNTDLGLSQDLYDLNNQFFDLFETEQMDDFKISWDGVNYKNAELIPSGEVNFSAICRENEQIGKVKEYITLFAIVGASLTLLKFIWNMIAEMLGLNQTLMETDFGDAVMYTYEDNSYDVDTRSYLDSKRYRKKRR